MKSKEDRDELRREYDFHQLPDGVRGKYARRYAAGSNVVVLEPDVAEAFPTEQSVNDASRMLLRLARSAIPLPR
jgi:hypothetical protein